MVAPAQTEKKKASAKKKRMVAIVMLEEFVSKQQYKDAEEMTQWRNISKEGMAALMKESCGNMEEEVLEKYNVEETEKGCLQGVGERLMRQIMIKEKRYRPWK